jgi:hypothetical protein
MQHAVEYLREQRYRLSYELRHQFGIRPTVWLGEPVRVSVATARVPQRALQPQMVVEIVPSGSCGTQVVFRFE